MKYLIVAAVLSLSVLPAFAHSKANKMVPADGAVISVVPEQVSMNFSDTIRLTKVSLRYAGTDARALDLGDQKAFAKSFTVPLSDLGRGLYVIEWRGLSRDGHATKGSFSFEVE